MKSTLLHWSRILLSVSAAAAFFVAFCQLVTPSAQAETCRRKIGTQTSSSDPIPRDVYEEFPCPRSGQQQQQQTSQQMQPGQTVPGATIVHEYQGTMTSSSNPFPHKVIKRYDSSGNLTEERYNYSGQIHSSDGTVYNTETRTYNRQGSETRTLEQPNEPQAAAASTPPPLVCGPEVPAVAPARPTAFESACTLSAKLNQKWSKRYANKVCKAAPAPFSPIQCVVNLRAKALIDWEIAADFCQGDLPGSKRVECFALEHQDDDTDEQTRHALNVCRQAK